MDTIPGIYNFIFKIQPYYAILVLEPFPLPLHNPNHPFAIHLGKMFLILFKKKKLQLMVQVTQSPLSDFFLIASE